jgi:hypothetical protein
VLTRFKVGVAVVLGAAHVFVGPTTPALAGGSPERVDASTGPDAVTPKTVTAQCPDGWFVFATGARIIGGDGGVVLTGAEPSPDLTSVSVTASAREWFDGDWSLKAFAVCDQAMQPRLVSETVYGQTEVTVRCPGLSRLTGAGFRLDGPVESVGLREVAIGPGLQEARVGVGATGTASPTSVTVHGICRWRPAADSPVGVVVHNPGTVDDTWPKVTTAEDSTLDLRLYGVAATVSGPADAFLTALVPGVNHDVATAEATRSGPSAAGLRAGDEDDDDGSLSASGLFIGTFH